MFVSYANIPNINRKSPWSRVLHGLLLLLALMAGNPDGFLSVFKLIERLLHILSIVRTYLEGSIAVIDIYLAYRHSAASAVLNHIYQDIWVELIFLPEVNLKELHILSPFTFPWLLTPFSFIASLRSLRSLLPITSLPFILSRCSIGNFFYLLSILVVVEHPRNLYIH